MVQVSVRNVLASSKYSQEGEGFPRFSHVVRSNPRQACPARFSPNNIVIQYCNRTSEWRLIVNLSEISE